MAIHLKNIADQTIVITGASSGIGLTTARLAASRGARLVLAARSEAELEEACREIEEAGGQAVPVACDVGSEADLRRVAHVAVEQFGGFDTWVNNAGVSIYGRIEEVALDDHRRLFETNFWGVVHGSLVALSHFGPSGGALINIGSTLSERAIPLQGMYCASKHAVKGFTDALRMEVEEAGTPVAVTLIKPAAIDTPYSSHARNYMPHAAQNPPPVYAPELVASAILHAATHPTRDLFVGGAGKAFQVMEKYMPRITDRYMERTLFAQQQKEGVPPSGLDALHEPSHDLRERGDHEGRVLERSLYTSMSMHPGVAAALGLVGGAAAALAIARFSSRL